MTGQENPLDDHGMFLLVSNLVHDDHLHRPLSPIQGNGDNTSMCW